MDFPQFQVRTCSLDSVYHYMITYCLPVLQHHSPALYPQYLQFYSWKLFWNYSLCSEVPIIPEIMPTYFVYP